MNKLATLLIVASLSAFAFGCAADDGESITTDFGDAVATSERLDNGDISTFLTSPAGNVLYGELTWVANTGEFEGAVINAPLPFDGVMELAGPLDDLNVLLHTLWEIELDDPPGVMCTQNAFAICCRDDGWRCQALAQ